MPIVRSSILIAIIALLPWTLHGQTNISGVVNQYTKVTAMNLCADRVEVTNASIVSKGSVVLLVQMQGATIDEGNNSSFGNITSRGNVGNYERAVVDTVLGTTVVFEKALTNTYDVADKVQLVVVPQYLNAIVNGTLTGAPWDGDVGGVLAIEVTGDLTLQADIDMSKKGYRGAAYQENLPNNCSWLITNADYFYNNTTWRASLKGEGIAAAISGKEAGKGAQANGGGGANDHNAGGAGGANYGAGGNGGRNNEPGAFRCRGLHPGIGGRVLNFTGNQIFMGGGGGSGHGNNTEGSGGGNGGGIILLTADRIIGNNHHITSNGDTTANAIGDGVGGAGAGGSVLLNVNQFDNSTLTISVRGGKGGDADNAGQDRCFGPGGGGGGGVVRSKNALPVQVQVQTNGGVAGITFNSTNGCNNSTNSATAGGNGTQTTGLTIPEGTQDIALSINTQPVNQQACAGLSASFSVQATGFGPTYTWQADTGTGFITLPTASPYNGTNTDQLSINPITSNMSGWQFRCVVGSFCDFDDTSQVATLTVDPLPQVTSQPIASINVCDQGTALISMAGNAATTTYQWQEQQGSGFSNITDNATFSGTGTAQLSIQGIDLSMQGYQYRCIVSGTCPASDTSSFTTLVVDTAPVITAQPPGVQICSGGDIHFKVSATGTQLTYQWQQFDGVGFVNVVDGPTVSGSQTDSLHITSVTAATDGARYRCLVSGLCTPAVVSQEAKVQVEEQPNIIQQPNNLTVCEGAAANFNIGAQGGAITYQWEIDQGSGFSPLTDGSIYSGATSSTLTISTVNNSLSGTFFRCIVSNSCGSVSSIQVQLDIRTLPQISRSPIDQTICAGANTGFGLAATGSALTYQWQADDGNGFVNLSNNGTFSQVNTDSLFVSNAAASLNGWQFRCVVSGQCSPSATSNIATLTVTAPVSITQSPQDTTVCEGGSVVFTVAVDDPTVGYQWQLNTGTGFQDISNNAMFSGVQSANLSVSNIGYAMNGWVFRCAFNSCAGEVTSNSATLTVNPLPIPVVRYSINEDKLTVTDSSRFASSISWDFGDGSPSDTAATVVHQYPGRGQQYTITLSASNPCGTRDTSFTVLMPGKPIVNPNLQIYPNPTETSFNLIFGSSRDTQISVEWFSMDGRRIYREAATLVNELYQREYDIYNLARGVYVIRVKASSGTYIKKLVKN